MTSVPGRHAPQEHPRVFLSIAFVFSDPKNLSKRNLIASITKMGRKLAYDSRWWHRHQGATSPRYSLGLWERCFHVHRPRKSPGCLFWTHFSDNSPKCTKNTKEIAKNLVKYSNFAGFRCPLPSENFFTRSSQCNWPWDAFSMHVNHRKRIFKRKSLTKTSCYAFPENWPFPVADWNRKWSIPDSINRFSWR